MCMAIPGIVVSIKPSDGLSIPAIVGFGEIQREVDLAMVPKTEVGDYVIVHSGFAISTLSREAATDTLDLIRQTGETLSNTNRP